MGDRLMRGANRYSVGNGLYTEDESSDSAASSEFSTTQLGSNNGTVPPTRTYVSQGYGSSASSKVKMDSTRQKVLNVNFISLQYFHIPATFWNFRLLAWSIKNKR